MLKGEIANVITEKGFGFITPEGSVKGDKGVFFHISGLVPGLRIETLNKGDAVEYEMAEGPKGPFAKNVKLAGSSDSSSEESESEDMQEAA